MRALVKGRIKRDARGLGFYNAGNFLIGSRTQDIISGLAIDATPRSVYVWSFILPRFDDLNFLHMSLGKRLIDASTSDYPIIDGLRNAWRGISGVRDASELIGYLDSQDIVGEYASWVRFLSFVRLGNFEEAEAMLDTVASLSAASIPRKLKDLQDVRHYGGWPAVQDLLDDWSRRMDKLVEGVPLET